METRTCECCKGLGYVEVGAGVNALEARWPELPIREMAERGWLEGVVDFDDVAECDSAFLRFWKAQNHAEVRAKLENRTLY